MKPNKTLSGMVRSLLACVSLWAANPSSAVETPVVVFDSFGPGNTYNTGVAWGIYGTGISAGYRGQAEWFVPTISGNLSNFTLATFKVAGTGRSNFFLAEDSGASTPGTILESFLERTITANGLMTVNSTSAPLLQAGTKYWLCQEPTDASTQNAWFQNNQNYHPGFAYDRGAWGWSFVESGFAPPSGVFRVSVTPVPEPSLLGFLIPGGWVLLKCRQRSVAVACLRVALLAREAD